MNVIKIKNKTIYFDMSSEFPNRDKSWELYLNDISVIGKINKMDGDEDSDFLLLIDKKLEKYFLSLNFRIDGLEIALAELARHFQIDFNKIVIDNAVVLYPKEIENKGLYKNSFVNTLKTVLVATHVADGNITDAVKNYVESKN